MPTITQVLDAVRVGDVIFGLGASGQEKLLLVYKTDLRGFSARHVTTQVKLRFNPDGKTHVYADGGYVTIVSIAPLPAEMHDVALGLDLKSAARPEYPDSILSKAEIELLLTYPKFFKARLLPGREFIVKAADKLNGVKTVLQQQWDPIHARDNPPAWDEYHDDLPVLIDLLDRQAALEDVASFLATMAARKQRTPHVSGRGEAAAATLVKLRERWT
ncbi:MAG: hypothetical protein JWR51_3669 [Devosia sp.]|uniref:hypothetical protein n=1 Tax=Devosia sp. TaxID=1871048 RepID=UPI00260C24EE|nr:hypothetical protein [Devosia sp.]MDB5530566.1 hypothetical protein [Devosia sp.]